MPTRTASADSKKDYSITVEIKWANDTEANRPSSLDVSCKTNNRKSGDVTREFTLNPSNNWEDSSTLDGSSGDFRDGSTPRWVCTFPAAPNNYETNDNLKPESEKNKDDPSLSVEYTFVGNGCEPGPTPTPTEEPTPTEQPTEEPIGEPGPTPTPTEEPKPPAPAPTEEPQFTPITGAPSALPALIGSGVFFLGISGFSIGTWIKRRKD